MGELGDKHWQETFRQNILGQNLTVAGQPVVYADWTASGRAYGPIEQFMTDQVAPWVANTHTESNWTGGTMTQLYHEARETIKRHVNAGAEDVLICDGTGMTGVVNKLQRILGLRVPEHLQGEQKQARPLVVITHMEHHSNQTSWQECDVDLAILPANDKGMPDLQHLAKLLEENQHRPLLLGSFTACSNVTGIQTPIHEMAAIMHQYGGLCLVDYAASAPYVAIDMHPEDPDQQLDGVMFSPHKFLGGPGSCGVLVFNKALYHNQVPDQPGGGTVTWTNPWGEHHYFDDIETREDGGTPGFLQAIRAALAIQVKEAMGVERIHQAEHRLNGAFFELLDDIPNLHVLAGESRDRLSIFSLYFDHLHYNLVVRLLNDHFGIQARGGCSCAGTYGHLLLGVDQDTSRAITCEIDQGNLSHKPGWIRISFHPTTSLEEVRFIGRALKQIADHGQKWAQDYRFDPHRGEYLPLKSEALGQPRLAEFTP